MKTCFIALVFILWFVIGQLKVVKVVKNISYFSDDSSRVKLATQTGSDSDYINANYIHVSLSATHLMYDIFDNIAKQ